MKSILITIIVTCIFLLIIAVFGILGTFVSPIIPPILIILIDLLLYYTIFFLKPRTFQLGDLFAVIGATIQLVSSLLVLFSDNLNKAIPIGLPFSLGSIVMVYGSLLNARKREKDNKNQ